MNIRREFTKLVSDHVFSYRHLVVDLAIVHGELEADEAGEDRGGSRLGLDGFGPLAGLGADDWETVEVKSSFGRVARRLGL